jgi:hypothetical protein
MGGDYGRLSFDALRDFMGVLIQQGHPILDSDWNELVAILERRLRAETVDTIGRAVVPRETPDGYEIQLAAGPVLTIGRGRMYVDGLLAENHGRIGPDAAPVFDRARLADGLPVGVLDEMISQEASDSIDYLAQPYLPNPPALPAGAGPHIVYVDVWRREVTPLKDLRLLEPALGGIDTATRWQTVWQVRLLADVGTGTTCETDVPAWDALIAPSPARLTTATITFEDPEDPCVIPPGGGYRGLENQLYRVEIHQAGALGAARFKWSRDNASVGATIESFDGNDRIIVRRVGRDSVLRLRTGDWVEVTDDRREFSGLPGDMRRAEVNEDTNEVIFDTPLSVDLIPTNVDADTAAARHSRVIKWDQSGQVRLADGSPLLDGADPVDLDDPAADGLIPVPADGSAVMLEAGVTVSFSTAPAGGVLRAFDHWIFAARTETRNIDLLTEAPPVGIHHHFARLAVVTFPATKIDCRTFWPPEFGAECGCTVCVSAEEHNSGIRTIQRAIDDLTADGGTVCLGPGTYVLGTAPIVIDNRQGVRLRGHGVETQLAYAGSGAAVRVTNSQDIRVSDIGIVATDSAESEASPTSGLLLGNGLKVLVEHCILAVASTRGLGVGIALNGFLIGVNLRDNAVLAPIAIGAVAIREENGANYCALFDAAIKDNILLATVTGVSLASAVVHLGPTDIASNLIAAGEAGVVATGAGFPVGGDDDVSESWSASAVTIRANTIGFGRSGDGVISGVPDLRLLDNEIVATPGERGDRLGNCVRLVAGILPELRPDGQLIGNRLGNVDGLGISIEAAQSALLIKRNVIRECGAGGIVAVPEVTIGILSLANNIIERIGGREVAGPIGGVRLAAAIEARVVDNAVRNIGPAVGEASYAVGFEMRGAAILDFAHNAIAGIGVPQAQGVAIGVLLDGVLLAGNLSSNRIVDVRPSNPNDQLAWCAILIDGRIVRGDTNIGFAAPGPFPAFFARGDALFVASAIGVGPFMPLFEGQIRISGNTVSDAHNLSGLPLVLVNVDQTAGVCGFAENHCTLMTDGIVPAIVALTAPRLIVANNAVRRLRNDRDAMHLTCRVIGNMPATTITGNITFGNIRVNGGNVPAPWAPLNILSQ